MASQTDLDQGGTLRQWQLVYLGPSVGWVRVPNRNVLGVTAPGTFTLDLSTNYVQVNINGLVTIILPTPALVVSAGATPGKAMRVGITVVDTGGFASGANPITIQPGAGATIMGLAQVQITSAYGGFILYPNAGGNLWTNQA